MSVDSGASLKAPDGQRSRCPSRAAHRVKGHVVTRETPPPQAKDTSAAGALRDRGHDWAGGTILARSWPREPAMPAFDPRLIRSVGSPGDPVVRSDIQLLNDDSDLAATRAGVRINELPETGRSRRAGGAKSDVRRAESGGIRGLVIGLLL